MLMKVGNLRVFECCCGSLAKPTLGPYWYWSWIPQGGCTLMIGGVLFFMTLSVPIKGSMVYTAWALILLEVLMFYILSYS